MCVNPIKFTRYANYENKIQFFNFLSSDLLLCPLVDGRPTADLLVLLDDVGGAALGDPGAQLVLRRQRQRRAEFGSRTKVFQK